MNIEKIMAVNTGSKALTSEDMQALLIVNQENPVEMALCAFNYDFSRGQRAGKARAKKKAVKS